MPTPILTDEDRALLRAAANVITNAANVTTERVKAAALLRKLAVPPTETGLLAFAQGEPNEYFITNNGHWLAAVKFNGELTVAEQEANLRAWLAGASALQLAQGRIDGLRRLCGYVEDSSDESVGIYQDDATRDWTVRVGPSLSPRAKLFHGHSMIAALDAAIAADQPEGS